MNLSFFISITISYIMALLAMAFYTLLERKALGYFQLRKGPNKVGIAGIPQPFADAIKLFTKQLNKPMLANYTPFLLAPMCSLLLTLLLWSLAPFSSPSFFLKFGALTFLCISSLNVYTTLASGWTSNSKYALLGALRSVAQTISYEVSMALIFLSALCLLLSFNLSNFITNQNFPIFLFTLPLFFSWFTTTLAETNRTPFDLAEGESELVSGFNIEYSSGTFALIFMAEYASILIMCFISTAVFLASSTTFFFIDASMIMKTFILAFIFLWIRATFPRMRYDPLMSLTWKSFLPMSLTYLLIIPSFMLLFW
uniref:NADH-ubiquinone oxidoreductase chain 1 n=1 Tax=Pista cristata TaxID=279652 RepID=B3TK03_9ANNE|nr:NADH dehydrogenase subunit 1 [Pista cristata]